MLGNRAVPPNFLGTWHAITECTSGQCGIPPYSGMRLDAEHADLLLGEDPSPVETVSAEAKGQDCILLGGFEDPDGRNIEPANLCLDTAGRLRGNVTRTTDDQVQRWLMRFGQLP
jgi:hypothetical protein